MPYARKIAVIFGYHCAPVEEVPEVCEYLDDFVRFVNEHGDDFLVFCGGPTFQTSYPGMTEARRMAEYVVPRIQHPVQIFLEEDSFTTYDNMEGAARIITEMKPLVGEWKGLEPRQNEISFSCEATRGLKVAYLARHFVGFPPSKGGPRIKIRTSSWELMHPLKEWIATTKDILACHFPLLNKIQRAKCIAKAKLR